MNDQDKHIIMQRFSKRNPDRCYSWWSDGTTTYADRFWHTERDGTDSAYWSPERAATTVPHWTDADTFFQPKAVTDEAE